MTIRLYDSRAQAKRDFVPIVPGQVGIYLCGPTVQSPPHIGHLRAALAFDLWRRWFEHRGMRVTLVRNVTDIDDKILAHAAATEHTDAPEQWWALAQRMERVFHQAYAAIGVLPPSYEPRATGHITEMVELIERLLQAGHAYLAADGSGEVYFDTASWPGYGELTRQRVSDMEDAADADPRGKRAPQDFALWKSAKPGEPVTASWPTPWGRGRPGWHIECSAMATRYLGAEFDIHAGGLDLRFPHHENELAQSTAAGDRFARYWLHNGLVTVSGQKMSKSLGNSLFASDLLAAASARAVRYFLSAAHYRSTIEFHQGSLAEAEAALGRIDGFLERARRGSGNARAGTPPEAFAAAMDDDLNMPQALAIVHDAVRVGNAALDAGDTAAADALAGEVRAAMAVLGLDPGSSAGPSDESAALAALVGRLLEERAQARARQDWAASDRIRDHLAAAGIAVEDTAAGPLWKVQT